jgi:cytochrome c-type biogenesis protein CcmF
MAFHRDKLVDLPPTGSVTMTDPFGDEWTFTSLGVSAFHERNRDVQMVSLAASVNGRDVGILSSSKRQHRDRFGNEVFTPSTEVGIRYGVRQDVYVVLSGVMQDQVAAIHINFNPLVMWVWLGGALMLIGGVIVMWPSAFGGRQQGYTAALRSELQLEKSAG